jgi:hypothetical protein
MARGIIFINKKQRLTKVKKKSDEYQVIEL